MELLVGIQVPRIKGTYQLKVYIQMVHSPIHGDSWTEFKKKLLLGFHRFKKQHKKRRHGINK